MDAGERPGQHKPLEGIALMGGNPGVESRPMAHKTAAGAVRIEQYHDRLQRKRHAVPEDVEVEILPNRLPAVAGWLGATQMEPPGLWHNGQPGHLHRLAGRPAPPPHR